MNDEILDFPEEEFYSGKIIAVKYFSVESEARLYTARLREAGIRSFLSNANTTNTLPLLGEVRIGLHVKESDLSTAVKIVKQLDLFDLNEETNESFHDADHDDIAYERDLRKGKDRISFYITLILLIIILAILIGTYLEAIK